MNTENSSSSQSSSRTQAAQNLWQLLTSKRISYLTLPLLLMATISEIVILTTGWKYQQVVCVPQGMGVTFFGIGPIGAVILAVEMLKLPLAIWTASRTGWLKTVMVLFGLPLICVLTFQLVKDMAVYEMGVAMTPASQMLEKATEADAKVAQLQGDLNRISAKKVERQTKLDELAARKAKAKADIEQSLKLNGEIRQDAISMTDYQKQQLAEVEAREAAITKQADADAAQLNKAIADLKAQREVEVGRAAKWNEEEARIENEYKTKMADYTNRKNAYQKALAEYNSANFVKRKLMTEPIDPGVPPEREVNTILKPTAVADIDAQINAKEVELNAVNVKRRDRIAQIEDDARKVREQFDSRSATKREEADHKREALLAAQANVDKEFAEQEKQVDQEYAAAAQKVDDIKAQIDASTKEAEKYYEEREASIRKTQVYRIATTVEIVRAFFKGQHPVTIKATAKERGDLYTDQISMVRIWVYPVLAFIVAFLPTLMVEVGFSTLFKPEEKEQKRAAHRLGWFGQRMHELYIRAGRQKFARLERTANEASAQISIRERALAQEKERAGRLIAEKDLELMNVRGSADSAAAQYEQQLKQTESTWIAKYTELVDSLNRAIAEKDALRDFQKSEIERQIQARQNAWSERVTHLRQELDEQRAAAESERTALMQEHQRKLMELTEDCKTQVFEARREVANAQLATTEATAKITHDLKEAMHARDIAEAQLKQLVDSSAVRLAQAKEESAREVERVARLEKQNAERVRVDMETRMHEREETFERRLQQRVQELTAAFDAQLAEKQASGEEALRRREAELQRQFDGRLREVDARWKQELQKREDAAQLQLQQREQQLFSQNEVRLTELRTQAEDDFRRRLADMERQLDAKSRDADARLAQELQQQELAFNARIKQRELEWTTKAAAREAELQNQFSTDLRAREEKWQRHADSRIQAVETLMSQDAQQKEELFQGKLRQRDQEWQSKLESLRVELRNQTDQELRRRDAEIADFRSRELKEVEAQVRKSIEEKNATLLDEARQREQDLAARLASQTDARQAVEKERDEVKQTLLEKRRQVHDLNNKLMQVSALIGGLNIPGFTNGNGNGNGNGKPVAVTTNSRNS